ncbi:serine protease 40-like [Cavia porcellus]|uniref:serine protease 40-like n=1 Tax=Cavia porcellus TaxID=10141 RepID=UPI002FE21332
MGSTRGQQSGVGGCRPWSSAVLLLWLHLLPPVASNSTPLSEICGRPQFTGKIFGGNAAKPGRWPWQASLLLGNQHICGATLIDKNWLISAAHCFQRSHNPSSYRILLGYNQLSKPTNYSLMMTVHKLIVHEDYNKYHRMSNDIVLMQLHRPVEFSSQVLPACLPDADLQLDPFTSCWITGWGMLTENTFLPQPLQLQEGEMSLIEQNLCAGHYALPPGVTDPNAYTVQEDMLCAAEFSTQRSICKGDSGGPLVCPVQGVWYLVGVTSWSSECLKPVGPSVFAKVSYFSPWIQEKKSANPDPDIALAPPIEKPPALTTFNSQDTIKPQVFMVLLSFHIFLL